jgi:hypothetical protein
MLRKSIFFDFLNRRNESDFSDFISDSIEDEHYINWNEFLLPHDYGDAAFEYAAIRNDCALFDASPIRKIRIHGSGSGKFFDRLLTRPVDHLASMRAIYAVFCNVHGTFKDDAILYKFADDDYLLMPSDIDHDAYFESLRERLGISDVSIVECTDSLVGISLQGPLSATVLHRWGFDGIEDLAPFEIAEYPLADGLHGIGGLMTAPDGSVWSATCDFVDESGDVPGCELLRFDGESWSRFLGSEGYGDIDEIAFATDGNVWSISGPNDLFVVSPEAVTGAG